MKGKQEKFDPGTKKDFLVLRKATKDDLGDLRAALSPQSLNVPLSAATQTEQVSPPTGSRCLSKDSPHSPEAVVLTMTFPCPIWMSSELSMEMRLFGPC